MAKKRKPKRRLKPAIHKALAKKLRLTKTERARLAEVRHEIFTKSIENLPAHQIRRWAKKAGLSVQAWKERGERSVRPFSRIKTQFEQEREEIWRVIKRGPNKGKFRNIETKEVKSSRNLAISLGVRRYWAQIHFLQRVLNISVNEARASFDVARQLPEFISLK